MKEEILQILDKYGALTLKDLERRLHVNTSQKEKELAIALNELEDEREVYNDHTKYLRIDNEHYMVGKARDVSRDDYAIINKDRKVYLPKNGSRVLLDRDEVLVCLNQFGNELLHIYERGIKYITGTFIRTRYGMKFRSDVNLHTSFIVTNMNDYHIDNNTKAVVKVTDYSAPLRVKIVELLGKEDEPGVDVSAILYENEVRQEFGKKVQKELKDIPERVHKKELRDRVDLRDLPTVTIDGESTKDFDDAVSIEKKQDGGWTLWVHIADVSYYVPEGEAIDEEAYKRGTSIYVADRVVPMLPFKLSNGICSLNPDVDRLTLTCKMNFDSEGKMIDSEVMQSVIHSNQRCTYGKVNEFLEDENSVPEYREVGDLLKNFSDLATQLKKQTEKRGHIDFETKEAYFVLDEKGHPVDVKLRERGWSEQMIEEAMVSANVAVAHELNSRSYPGMYRVHEAPDPEKIKNLVNLSRSMGVKCDIDPENVEPIDIQRFLAAIEDPDNKEMLAALTVRSMQKAIYSDQCMGHYGLALDEYCHFTSPIRRYPDLLIHRMLRRHLLEKKNDEKSIKKDQKRMEKSAEHLSEKERDAMVVERSVDDLEAAKYMEDKVGNEYDGIISGVASFGFFVELPNTIEGLVPLRTMQDDFYEYDADGLTLTGQNTHKTYSMSQPVHVRLASVDVAKRQITFEILDDLPAARPDDLPEVKGEDLPETVANDLPEVVQDDLPETVPNDLPETVSDDLPAAEPTELPATEPTELPVKEAELVH